MINPSFSSPVGEEFAPQGVMDKYQRHRLEQVGVCFLRVLFSDWFKGTLGIHNLSGPPILTHETRHGAASDEAEQCLRCFASTAWCWTIATSLQGFGLSAFAIADARHEGNLDLEQGTWPFSRGVTFRGMNQWGLVSQKRRFSTTTGTKWRSLGSLDLQLHLRTWCRRSVVWTGHFFSKLHFPRCA